MELLVLLVIAILGVITLIWTFVPRRTDRPISEQVLYARQGEIITCTNGHRICELSRDIYVNEPLMAEQLTNWKNQEPAKPCDVIMPCNTCGEPFVKSEMPYGGSWLYISGEWRTTLPKRTYG